MVSKNKVMCQWMRQVVVMTRRPPSEYPEDVLPREANGDNASSNNSPKLADRGGNESTRGGK
jgi:hypothetical protein